MIEFNPCLASDSYKVTHWLQDPPKTEFKRSYLSARAGELGETTFFGLQYYTKEYLTKVPKIQEVEYANEFWAKHFGTYHYFNYDGWLAINKMGYIPLRVKAVKEGTTVPHQNVLMWIENTVPGFGWLTQWYETLLMKVWYPTTVATLSRNIKKVQKRYFTLYTDLNKEQVEAATNFGLHGFGYRGNSSEESAMIGDAAHLINYYGTDTPTAIEFAKHYYNSDSMCAHSVFASEHSTMTILGRSGEFEQVKRILKTVPKNLIVSMVGDSYDIYAFCRRMHEDKEIKQLILEREAPTVIRPDSGEATEIIPDLLDILAEGFGVTKNSVGKDVLNTTRVLQGDKVDLDSAGRIYEAVVNRGYSPENISCLGMGGALIQKVDRDTHNFAIKCCSATIDGKDYDVFKNPVTQAMKASKRGILDLRKLNNKYHTVELGPNSTNLDYNNPIYSAPSELVTYFDSGKILVDDNFDSIRERAKI